MRRRLFDHLVLEISLALGRPMPRYALWLHLHGAGLDPEEIRCDQAAAYCGDPLAAFLAERGLALGWRRRRRLMRAVRRFDSTLPTPEEHFARF